MKEKRLDFNPLEVRGIFVLQAGVLQAAQAVDQATLQLRKAEAEAAAVLDGRVPSGVTIRNLRIDQQTSSVFVAEPESPPAA